MAPTHNKSLRKNFDGIILFIGSSIFLRQKNVSKGTLANLHYVGEVRRTHLLIALFFGFIYLKISQTY